MSTESFQITIAGCGPGAAEWVTPATRAAAEQAEVLVGAPRLLALFPHTAAAERLPVGARVEETLDRLAALGPGRRVVVLVSGDPGLFSLARGVIARFGRAACRVLPGISSLQLAFARLGLGWEDVRIVGGHAAAPTVASAALRDCPKIAVFLGHPESWGWLRATAAVLAATHRLYLCEHLSRPEERVRELDAPALAALAEPAALSLAVLVRREVDV